MAQLLAHYPSLNEVFLANLLLFEVPEIERIMKPGPARPARRLVLGPDSAQFDVG